MKEVFLHLSANPLHDGHTAMYHAMKEKYGNCTYVLSTLNADKGTIDSQELSRRVAQFEGEGDVFLFNTATFLESVEYLENKLKITNIAYVVGVDTMLRVVQPQYYRCSLHDVLLSFASRGVVFEVFSRNGLSLEDVLLSVDEDDREILSSITIDAGLLLDKYGMVINTSSTKIRENKNA